MVVWLLWLGSLGAASCQTPAPPSSPPPAPPPSPPALPQQDINILNCFDLVEDSQWPRILGLNQTTATLSVVVAGGGQSLVGCLGRQSVRYLVSVVGDTSSQPFLLADLHSWEGLSSALAAAPPSFPYLIYGGNYRLQVTHCGRGSAANSEMCSEGQDTKTVFSEFISIQPSVDSGCSEASPPANTSLRALEPALSGNTAVFHFSFSPCSSVQLYDTANITLFSAAAAEECGGQAGAGAVLEDVVSVLSSGGGEAAVLYTSPELAGDRFYCLAVSLSHISCRLVSVETPSYCYLQSDAVWLPAAAPVMAFMFPLCTDHLACAWLYIVVGAGSSLLVSCVLAICCVRCCDYCRREEARKSDEVDFSGEVISLAPVHDRISWAELHREWDTREDKARGKILLLYSPDTKLFKELQEAFKSFLDLACHCDIYDLFDDALFDTIALDPSEWLQEFVNDEDVKILVISSAGK